MTCVFLNLQAYENCQVTLYYKVFCSEPWRMFGMIYFQYMDEQSNQNPMPEKYDGKLYTVNDVINHPEQFTIKSFFGIFLLFILSAGFIWFLLKRTIQQI
jgi:hypothetical protein